MNDVLELIERLREMAPEDGKVIRCAGRTTAMMNTDIRAAADALTAALEREEALREVLRDIVDPISRMQREADKVGAILDGASAVRIADNPEYLRGIARTALENTNGN